MSEIYVPPMQIPLFPEDRILISKHDILKAVSADIRDLWKEQSGIEQDVYLIIEPRTENGLWERKGVYAETRAPTKLRNRWTVVSSAKSAMQLSDEAFYGLNARGLAGIIYSEIERENTRDLAIFYMPVIKAYMQLSLREEGERYFTNLYERAVGKGHMKAAEHILRKKGNWLPDEVWETGFTDFPALFCYVFGVKETRKLAHYESRNHRADDAASLRQFLRSDKNDSRREAEIENTIDAIARECGADPTPYHAERIFHDTRCWTQIGWEHVQYLNHLRNRSMIEQERLLRLLREMGTNSSSQEKA
ncbi:hypothetical protein JW968_01155 [Candidatus Woesearchaeota archaeon]|nr:hypothetical protein [Candidatus Woesearchaeota archaeon]